MLLIILKNHSMIELLAIRVPKSDKSRTLYHDEKSLPIEFP